MDQLQPVVNIPIKLDRIIIENKVLMLETIGMVIPYKKIWEQTKYRVVMIATKMCAIRLETSKTISGLMHKINIGGNNGSEITGDTIGETTILRELLNHF